MFSTEATAPTAPIPVRVDRTSETAGAARPLVLQTGGESVILLLLLALLAIIAFGVGFTVHWLFVVAIVIALLWVISFFAGGIGGRTARRW